DLMPVGPLGMAGGRPAVVSPPPGRQRQQRGAGHEHRHQHGDEGGLGTVTPAAQRVAVGPPSAHPAQPPKDHCLPSHCWRPFPRRHPSCPGWGPTSAILSTVPLPASTGTAPCPVLTTAPPARPGGRCRSPVSVWFAADVITPP